MDMNLSENIGDEKTMVPWKIAVNLSRALVTFKMAARKMVENFSRKLNSGL